MRTANHEIVLALSVVLIPACTDSVRHPVNEFCGKGFCVSGVSPSEVQSTRLSIDATRYVIQRKNGVIYILEDNFPDLQNLARLPVTELCHLRAWHLSPTRIPEILVLVGADWPHWLVIGIEGNESKTQDLVSFLANLRVTASPTDWPADVDRPTCAPADLPD